MPHVTEASRREYHRAWHKKNPLKKHDYHLRSRYGITLDQYDDLWIEQLGLCAICGKPGKLEVDHDHRTGAVRGLLDSRCNTALGRLGDNLAGLARACGYLRAA